MALGSISELVQQRLNFLTVDEIASIDGIKLEFMYEIQEFTKLDDGVVEDESSYTNIQILLIADATAYYLLNGRSLKGLAEDQARKIKKVKADVVETEFTYESGKAGFNEDTGSLKEQLRKQACARASRLGYSLALCNELQNTDITMPIIAVAPLC